MRSPSPRELHAVDDIPVIIVAEDSDTLGRVRGLTCADDYVVLPVAPAEVAARVGAVLRRARPCREPAAPVFDDGRVRIDVRRRVVTAAGRLLALTPTEFRLLALLVRGAGRVFTHDQLLCRVWGSAAAGDSHLLRLHIANLRRTGLHPLHPHPPRCRLRLRPAAHPPPLDGTWTFGPPAPHGPWTHRV